LQCESLDHLHECQKILSIKFKKVSYDSVNYLTIEGIKLLLQQPDATTIKGRRDLALLSLMYDTGARVQEIIDLTPSMLRLNKPSTIKIIGKGNKARLVPMLDAQIGHLENYLKENKLTESHANMHPLFFNSRKEKLTRAGVNHILWKYSTIAREKNKMIIPDKISCHSLRHSKAMHLLQAGVNLVYIRDILGHVSIQTTEIYARADSQQKRTALEKAYVKVNPGEEPMWTENENLITWLKRF
jgi:integrase/recombinase XerD